jgi:ankyrin repeat protein
MRIIEKLKHLQIDIKDLQLGLVFSRKPFEKKYSKQFIEACKDGNDILVSEYLSKSKFLVYDFDYTHKTALHWAAIRSSYAIMEQLIVFHADVDAKDLMNKTALHYAAQINDIIAIKILLSNHADPFIHCNAGLEPKEMATSLEAKILFKKARKIRVIMKWVPYESQKNYLITTLREINDTEFA